jgi:4-hydroxy-3-methylbut-2-enyl diphosphate reductase
LQSSIETASTVLLGGSLLDRPGMDDRSLGASDVLASLMD